MLSILVLTQEHVKEKVSRKALLPKPEGYVDRPPRIKSKPKGRDNRRQNQDRKLFLA